MQQMEQRGSAGSPSHWRAAVACGDDDSSARAAPAATRRRRQETTTMTLIAGVKGDEFYITMNCGAQEKAKELGRHPRLPGPGQVRRRACRRRSSTRSRPRSPTRCSSRRPTPRRCTRRSSSRGRRLEGRAGRHHARAARHRGLADRLGQRGRRQGGRPTTLLKLIGGKGKVFVVNVKPGISTTDPRGKGFEEAAKASPGSSTSARSTRNDDPAKAAAIVTAHARQAPRPQGHLRHEPVLRRGRRERPAAGGQARRGEDRRLRRRPQAGRGPRGRARAGADRPEAGRHRRPGRRAGLQRARRAGDDQKEIGTGFEVITKDNLDQMQDVLYKPSC